MCLVASNRAYNILHIIYYVFRFFVVTAYYKAHGFAHILCRTVYVVGELIYVYVCIYKYMYIRIILYKNICYVTLYDTVLSYTLLCYITLVFVVVYYVFMSCYVTDYCKCVM